YRVLDLAGDAQVVRAGEAVADDRALECDDGAVCRDRDRDLGMDQHTVSLRRRSSPTGTVTSAATTKEIIDALIQLAGEKCSQSGMCPHIAAHQDTYPGLISW